MTLVKHTGKNVVKTYNGQNLVNLLGKLSMQNIPVKTARYALCAYNQLFMYHKYILKKGFLKFRSKQNLFPICFY